ncbi:MAG: alpha/beta fold hydrolase [Ilumatobacteraceae bacterium]
MRPCGPHRLHPVRRRPRRSARGRARRCGRRRCSLIGYSWGGPAAATFAARHPERMDRLVLYATSGRPGTASASKTTPRSFSSAPPTHIEP